MFGPLVFVFIDRFFGICDIFCIFSYFRFNIESAHGKVVVATIVRVKEFLEREDLVIL
jgi:hypothetical protein